MTPEWIDVHAHYVTARYARACRSAGHERPDGMPGRTVEAAPDVMGRAGIAAAAQAGARTLTRALGREWAPQGVRVVAVAPGHSRTPMIERGIVSGAGVVAVLVGPLVLFVTGTVIAVDSGSGA